MLTHHTRKWPLLQANAYRLSCSPVFIIYYVSFAMSVTDYRSDERHGTCVPTDCIVITPSNEHFSASTFLENSVLQYAASRVVGKMSWRSADRGCSSLSRKSSLQKSVFYHPGSYSLCQMRSVTISTATFFFDVQVWNNRLIIHEAISESPSFNHVGMYHA